MADLTLKRHDTYPPLRATLSDQDGPIDLTTAVSVKVILKGQTVLVTGTCTITSPSAGQVSYQWATGDTAVTDTYNVEFEINWGMSGPTTLLETVPNSNYNTVDIVDDLENA